jgi:hypothetical protein
MTLFSSSEKRGRRTGTLLADGYVEVDGKPYRYPSTAAAVIAGRPMDGGWFFRVDRVGGRSLRDVLSDCRTRMALDGDSDPEDATEDGEEAGDGEETASE